MGFEEVESSWIADIRASAFSVGAAGNGGGLGVGHFCPVSGFRKMIDKKINLKIFGTWSNSFPYFFA